jgi:cyclic pyranopterin monophosphate synthase
MREFTHLDHDGKVRMVDVGEKSETHRKAIAKGRIFMEKETLALITNEKVKKGNVLETARIAGIMAAKKTSELIPMCHPLNITHIRIDFSINQELNCIDIVTEASLKGRTGVEMEVLTSVSVAALTIYDMCKSYDKAMKISDICLVFKSGGKSGIYDAS